MNRYILVALASKKHYAVVEHARIDHDQSHLAPVGFRTDGASVPRMLWPFVGSPFAPDVIDAAINHDHAYQYGVPDRATADENLRRNMIELGVSPLRARIYWLGVRAFGWLYWRRCRFGRGL